jgi:hypothetical protein
VALEMRPACERGSGPLEPEGEALICSYERALCRTCAAGLEHVCPNCSGGLVPRPTREA